MPARRILATALLVAALPGGLVLSLASASGGRRLLAEGTATGGDPAAAVAGLVALLTAALVGWLTATLLLAIAATLPGEIGRRATALRDRVTPALVRRWAAIALGASVTASVLPGTAVAAVAPGTTTRDRLPEPGWRAAEPTSAPAPTTTTPTPATPTHLPGPGWAGAPTTVPAPATAPTPATTPTPGWVPRRPPARQGADPHLLTGHQRPRSADEVVVHRGDSLWSIAARRLGSGATAAEVARAWPRWYAANRELIGPDPHRLLPGTVLTPPTTTTHPTDRHDPGTLPATEGTP